MKLNTSPMNPIRFGVALAFAAAAFSAHLAQASPYASGITNNNGKIQFVMNEGGATVNVVFEDGTTNALGVLPKGATNFSLGTNTSYRIICAKTGNGTPAQISTDTDVFAHWNSPRGVAVNQNAKIGSLFGRTYVGNSTPGGTAPNAKGQGLYALNADQTEALGNGTNAAATATFSPAGASGPYKLRVAPDNTLLVGDGYLTAAAALWQFQPDLSNSNLVLAIIGQAAAEAAGIHGDLFGTPLLTGSLAASNLVLWVFDSGLAVPSASIAPGLVLGPGTSRGSFNCAYRYDIGAGPLPWSNAPNYAYTMGLDGIATLRTEGDLGKDGKIICGYGRANLSNPDIQILDPTGSSVVWTSWIDTGGANDPWRGEVNGTAGGTYCGVRVSADGRFLASVDINNGITLANLTNGLPDDSSIFGITNASTTGNSRGMSWDAADNIYVCSSGQGLLRVYSLGITTTCVTSNDFTGANGSFQLILPPVGASIVATTPTASQNYINNSPNPGTPIPGVFTITLSTNVLATPVTVNFTRSGTATYPSNYTMLNGVTDANGVLLGTNSVTFPAGTFPGAGSWSAQVQIIPTAFPLTGPTLAATLTVNGGANYLSSPPVRGTLAIQNTGPQFLQLSAAASGATMNRGIPGDYAQYVITRWGDTNGPGNSPGNVTPTTYTVTNFTTGGTAVFPVDYTAGPQNLGTGTPANGTPGISVAPGLVVFTNIVGNPVSHANLAVPPTNVTVILNLTNAVLGTNLTSSEGSNYLVTTAAVTLTELDNTVGSEVVIWSNPLTNALDSVNWTLTFAGTNLSTTGKTVLPVVIPNYTNGESSTFNGGTNDFRVVFGYPIALDSVSPSPVMAANGWTNVLKMTVNKDGSFSPCGVNLYPQGVTFAGNYALRFSMYLEMYQSAVNNPFVSPTLPREFAEFGINHAGTNCNWRLASPIAAGTGNSTTNADGVWFAIDAGGAGASPPADSVTPADFDGFTSPPLPNPGVGLDLVSNNAQSQNGAFKRPPFDSIYPFGSSLAGGQPIDKWVDVSVEVTAQTNVTLYMDRAQVLPSFVLTNGSPSSTNGTIMLGYLDPVNDESDLTAFTYYSNVRVVELSPYITAQPLSMIVTQGANLTITNSATFATVPGITNVWYVGISNPVVALLTNTANATNLTSVLSVNNDQSGTNYLSVFSDAAGSVTSLVAVVEVIQGPTNATVNAGVNFTFQVTPTGQAAPTSFRWQTNGVNLATNNPHYAGVTTSAMTINNVQPGDAQTYSVVVVNAAGTVTPSATLTVTTNAPFDAVVAPASQTNLWGSTASFSVTASGVPPFTYQWKKGGTNLSNGGNVSGATTNMLTLSSLTRADASSYTAGVTNGSGGTISSAGVLTVLVPPPTFSTVSVAGANVVMLFSSTNSFDTTNAFILQSSPVVTGPYTNTTATFTTNGGKFQVTVPETGSAMFYRLLHVN